MSKLSWGDRFALIEHFKPTDDQVRTAFEVTQAELDTARQLLNSGTFVPTANFDTSSYAGLFDQQSRQLKAPSATVHTMPPATATKQTATVAKVPGRRGRKSNKIASAFAAIPTTPISAEDFTKQHGISLAVLRQSKRFVSKMDTNVAASIGTINVRQDKTTKTLMVWSVK